MHFAAESLRRKVAAAARCNVFVGTSSWKYAGWLGLLYDEQHYLHRGKLAESRFDRDCLAEYAECFPTVCVDAAYYTFPSVEGLQKLQRQVPAEFLFSFKVTEDVTVKRFPNFPRYGKRAGLDNPRFLNAALFVDEFLGPCEHIRPNVGLLMFEFSRFYKQDFASGREFVERLDEFLGQLPQGWNYGVEIRNAGFLHPEYFAMLSRHGVSHVFNSWEAMPPVSEQLAMLGSLTNPDCVGARFLLKPGRAYEQAVAAFQPYDKVQEPLPEAREAGAKLISRGLSGPKAQKTLIYVNNRLEGNALGTLAAMLDAAGLGAS
jgi:uncharacterized protein YecE (DUF72 family)